MRTPTLLRRKSVKEALQRFVERVSQIPQVQAVLMVQGDGGWEIWTAIERWEDAVVDDIIEQEGSFLDDLLTREGAPAVSGFHIVILQGRSLEEFLSPMAKILFRRD